MFGIVDQLLLRPPPYLRDPGRVHRVYLTTSDDGRDVTDGFTEYTRYLDLTRFTKTLDATAAFAPAQLRHRRRRGREGDAGRHRQRELLELLRRTTGARPVLHASEDSIPTGSPVVVLSYALLAGALRRIA